MGKSNEVSLSGFFHTSALTTALSLDFPGGSDGKASAYNVGDPGSIPGSGRSPGEGNAWKTPWTEEPGRLPCPWGRKESDMTERLSFLSFILYGSTQSFACKQPQQAISKFISLVY